MQQSAFSLYFVCLFFYLQASDDLLREHYGDLKDRPFFPGLVSYMSSGPVVAMVSLFIYRLYYCWPSMTIKGHFLALIFV